MMIHTMNASKRAITLYTGGMQFDPARDPGAGMPRDASAATQAEHTQWRWLRIAARAAETLLGCHLSAIRSRMADDRRAIVEHHATALWEGRVLVDALRRYDYQTTWADDDDDDDEELPDTAGDDESMEFSRLAIACAMQSYASGAIWHRNEVAA
jgi:hypothetical protein